MKKSVRCRGCCQDTRLGTRKQLENLAARESYYTVAVRAPTELIYGIARENEGVESSVTSDQPCVFLACQKNRLFVRAFRDE